ncbi:MAG TPA: CCA tRNA nucleotidyltransferase [Pseudobacteroides sp.]|uniref:CCA tRNA nucleotidyltransferase n=1 Tax=Pseudobacteroides sp. TaxID=1968840 RepID=UPI002F939332
MKKDILLPDDVLSIITRLNTAGYEAFAVGGCVRDSLLNKTPKDWDITTNSLPHNTKSLFEKTIDTGLKHGTVTVVINNESYEITTYRIDGEYSDNRRPDSVEFTASLKEDLSRRDFTVNALAYNPSLGVIDYFEGINDLDDKVIRAVRNADERFKEDALRMLRAIRFSAQLGFRIESQTLKAISQNKELINNISPERIREELTKILVSPNPSKLLLLHDTGLLKFVLPEFESCIGIEQNNPYHMYNVDQHTILAVSGIECDKILRWTMLLHDIGKAVTKTTDSEGIDHFHGHQSVSVDLALSILKRLRFDNKSIDIILKLIKHHDMRVAPDNVSIKKALKTLGKEAIFLLLKVKEADIRAQNTKFLESRLVDLAKIKCMAGEIIESNECFSLDSLAISGDDLINLGISQGRNIGIILNKLLDMVIESPQLNTYSHLCRIVGTRFLGPM